MRRLLFGFVLVVLVSCGGSKQLVDDSLFPLWLKEKPASSEFFDGIGSSRKIGTPDSYMKAARENALADMSQQISVKISSVSIMNLFEGDNELHEIYNQRIKAVTSEIFEGVELVDQFDDGVNYHTYYQISKAEFFRLKALRKRKALEKGLSYYNQAMEQYKSGDISKALSSYVMVVDAVVNYLNEETVINNNGEDINLVYAARTEFDRICSSLVLKPKHSFLNVRRGEAIGDDRLAFSVLCDGHELVDIPVSFKYSGGYLKQKHVVSDYNGSVATSIQRLKSNKSVEIVTAQIDVKGLVRKASTSLFVRKIFGANTPKDVSVRLNVVAPSIKFVADKDFPRYSKRLKLSLANKGLQMNGGDDYTVRFSMHKEVKRVSYGVMVSYSVGVDVQSVEDDLRQKVFSYKFSGDAGDVRMADNKALVKVNRAFDRRIVNEVSRFVMR